MAGFFAQFASWLNENQGVLSLVLFITTVFVGWVTGLFSSFRQKAKFRVSVIPGPSFICVMGVGRQHGEYEVHRTAVAIYLNVVNVGSVAGQIERIDIGYRWALRPLTPAWFRYGLGRFWIHDQSVALEDFQVVIGDKTKIYPFLTQRSHLSGASSETYLLPGQLTNGVVYFEQADSYGGCFPYSWRNKVKLKISLVDTTGRAHVTVSTLSKVNIAEARLYNPSFGLTLSSLRGDAEPFDLPVDSHGNLLPPKKAI